MESTDFIWVACSRCPQEGSRCWVEGQVLPEKLLLPIPSGASASLLSRGWWWLSALHRGARELPQRPVAAAGVTARPLLPWEGAWELGVAPYFFRCPWAAVWERGGLCHVPAVAAWGRDPAAWEASGLWTMGCPVWPGLGKPWLWGSHWTGGERPSLLRVPVGDSRAWMCPQFFFIF